MIFKKKSKQTTDSLAPTIPVDKNRLYADVEFLTSLKPARNYRNKASLKASVDYITQCFEKLDCKVEKQVYQAEGDDYENIIATFNPKPGPRIVIGAHYDVCEEQPGADDNASAVAGLLEIARLVDSLKPVLNCQIDFVAYCLEEPPFFASEFMGSAVHARSLKEANVKLKAMICLEMIGYFTDEPNSQKYPLKALSALYPSVGNFIAVVGQMGQNKITKHMKKYMLAAGDVPVYSINAPKMMTGIDFSDHRSYWEQGYEAVMINNTSFYRNPNYHQVTDTIETLDFDRMAEVVKGVYWALVNLE